MNNCNLKANLTMQTSLMKVTPAIAEKWLKKNSNNRPMSRSKVRAYARDMRSGQWDTTHQGICLGADDVVIDGQHRLTAIVEAGATVFMNVTIDRTKTSAKAAIIDRGYVRAEHYILDTRTDIAATSRFVARVVDGHVAHTTHEIEPYVSICSPVLTDPRFCTTALAGIANAAMLSALVAGVKVFDADYAYTTYSAMVRSDFEKIAPYPSSLFRQVVVERRRFTHMELFSRSVRIFDKRSSSTSKLLIRDENYALSEARDVLKQAIRPT